MKFFLITNLYRNAGFLLNGLLANLLGVGMVVDEGVRSDLTETRRNKKKGRNPPMGISVALVEKAIDIIYRYRLAEPRGFEYINPAVQTILGYTPDEIYADPDLLFRAVHPEDLPLLENRLKWEGNADAVVIRWLAKDGRTVWLEHRDVPIRDKQGSLMAGEGVARDITQQVLSQQALARSEELFNRIFNANPVCMSIASLADGRVIEVNRRFCELLSLTREEVIGRTLSELEIWVDPKEAEALLARLVEEGRVGEAESLFRRKSGEKLIGLVSLETIDLQGEACILAAIWDITERKRTEKLLQWREKKFRLLYEDAPLGYQLLGRDGTILEVNQTWLELVGYERSEVIGRWFGDFLTPESAEYFRMELGGYFAAGKVSGVEFELVCKDGNTLLTTMTGHIAHTDSGQIPQMHCILYDITDRKVTEDKLRFISTHDTLTNLYNRSYFEEVVNRCQQSGQYPISVVIADVDGLKAVNDSLGHAAGDEVLCRAANALRAAFRDNDVIARTGGDEFAVLIPNADAAVASQAIGRVRTFLEAQNRSRPELPISLSIGAATAEDAAHLQAVIAEADRMMYREKLRHREVLGKTKKRK